MLKSVRNLHLTWSFKFHTPPFSETNLFSSLYPPTLTGNEFTVCLSTKLLLMHAARDFPYILKLILSHGADSWGTS